MVHEFINLDRKDIPQSTTYSLKGNNEVVILDDYIVVNNPLFLNGFKTYKVSFDNPGEGLDYFGNTIIPPSSISDFINNLTQVKNGSLKSKIKTSRKIDKNLIRKQLENLIAFCEKALNENKFIIHFGL